MTDPQPQGQRMVMAQVTIDNFGRLEATLNPNLSDQEKTVLACQCAEMFAKLGANGAMALGGEDAGKPKILVPKVGFRL
jgi:hypothetical protein